MSIHGGFDCMDLNCCSNTETCNKLSLTAPYPLSGNDIEVDILLVLHYDEQSTSI